MTAGLSALVRDMTGLARELTAMFAELRGLARDFRAPDAPTARHPWDASPLPSEADIDKGIEEEKSEWRDLASLCAEPGSASNGAAAETVAPVAPPA